MGFALSDMALTSTAFDGGAGIPATHSSDGGNVSPPLAWSGAPEGVRSFALFCHDPDAPLVKPDGHYGVVHWVVYGIPATTTSLPAGVADGVTLGVNDSGGQGYYGPQPPPGHGPHHYVFWLLALDADPDLASGLSLPELLSAVEPHVVAMNRLVGTFENPAG